MFMRQQNLLVSIPLLFSLIVCLPSFASAQCDREEAHRRMFVLGNHIGRLHNELDKLGVDHPEYRQQESFLSNFAVEHTKGGAIMATQDWNKACAHYAAVAKQFDLSLEEKGKKVLSVERLEKDGGRTQPGGCNLEEAALKMAGLNQTYVRKIKAGELSRTEQDKFTSASRTIGVEMTKDPSNSCKMMDKLKAEINF